ncbi:MAG: type IV secretion system protein, partial [Sphingomicrobium sp.]
YPRTTLVEVRVKSASPIGPGTVLVRFDTVRSDAGARPSPPGYWVAVIRYRYSRQPMKLEDRLVNPLGFQVVSYRKDPEAPPPPASDAGPDLARQGAFPSIAGAQPTGGPSLAQ